MHPSSWFPDVRPWRSPPRLALVLATSGAVALAPPPDAFAQTRLVDRGTFAITREGRPAGREQFEIRHESGLGGAVLRARGTVSSGAVQVAPSLTTTDAGVPLSYQVDVQEDGALTHRVTGTAERGRLTLRASGSAGVAAREYLAGDAAAIVDRDVVHHHWFLVRAPDARPAQVIVPRAGIRATVRVREIGPEAVRIGDVMVPATRLMLDGFPDGPRTVWIDAERRLLRVSIPGNGVDAVRQNPPG